MTDVIAVALFEVNQRLKQLAKAVNEDDKQAQAVALTQAIEALQEARNHTLQGGLVH